jgi:hypothetical protein
MPAQLISKAADWNNSLPRKILGYKTPAEMFEIEILKTAQGAAQRKGRSGPCSYVFHLGKGKKSLWHLLHMILQFIRLTNY